MSYSVAERREMVERNHDQLSIEKQCQLLGIARSGYYYKPAGESSLNMYLMRRIDEHFLTHPFKGTRRMTEWLKDQGYEVNRKRVQKLFRKMGLEAIYPKPDLSKSDPRRYKYRYLLRGRKVMKPNEVWAIDITYIPMARGFMYLAAIMDLFSRYVVGWSLSNTMEAGWITDMVRKAIKDHGVPEIQNSDQGTQFTSQAYIELLETEGIQISMDGKGRATDNIFIERLWRSLKYEYIYLNPATDGLELYQGLAKWFWEYNHQRHHQGLGYQKPYQLFHSLAA